VLRVVATATSEPEVEMICARLSNAGIEAVQKQIPGGPGLGVTGAREVYVQEQDAERAIELLDTQEFSDEELSELSERAYDEQTGQEPPAS
jgi:hypothetical protein